MRVSEATAKVVKGLVAHGYCAAQVLGAIVKQREIAGRSPPD